MKLLGLGVGGLHRRGVLVPSTLVCSIGCPQGEREMWLSCDSPLMPRLCGGGMLQRAALLWGMGSIVTAISFWLPFLNVLAISNMSGGWDEVVMWGVAANYPA